MRITLRIVLSLLFVTTLVVTASTFIQARSERRRLLEDLERRSAVLADTLDDAVVGAVTSREKRRLSKIAERYSHRGRLTGIAIYSMEGELLASSKALKGRLEELEPLLKEQAARAADFGRLRGATGAESFLFASAIEADDSAVGTLALVHDASFIGARIKDIWQHNFFRLLAQALLISLASLWIVRWTITDPVAQLAEWMRQLRAGEPAAASFNPHSNLLQPLAAEAAQLAKSLSAARNAAENEARLRQRAESMWTPERLKEHVRVKLSGGSLFVVANREPYMHVRRGQKTAVITPASGLVTGLEPILRACGGMWVAHAGGDADRENSDATGKLAVPPGEPQYTLKRVWMTTEQEEGYYYGFSNEGLWPLCHNVHARPVFKAKDWTHYQNVNRLFADALLEEMRDVERPYVLIQDYHFALLPALVKEARPDARVASFWHIPWPNPEAFGICPWQREILEGLLGADLLGFHTQFHCNNFLETVDRTLECRLDWERFAVQRGDRTTLVKPFPISVAFPTTPQPPADKEALFKQLGVQGELLGVGVDRIDYTKGILERFAGIERFLDKHPQYQGRFTFAQIGAPSRTHIQRYRDLFKQIEAEADRINWKFKPKDGGSYKAIVLLSEHHAHEQIQPFYRAADLCLVTSLHDGMNLVAKEFVASRDDESGVLILSRFTGAARELRDALIVNPYDFEQMAEALRYAVEMEPEEASRRMRNMRQYCREHNVYAWGAALIDGLTAVRTASAPVQV